ncbi:ubiquitin carboxyl-terminal hydrolase 20 isoform X2 [Hydra vulgaris]|uniref:Ubiquitin carboxyl-terminal hydrolase n=1 Tax=Hydra vulgaris TaxID=6087 RepID=A0ABM4BCT3_HYDVU
MELNLMEEQQELFPQGLCGLINIGNTCYMNSALQALSNCSPLTKYFLKCNDVSIKFENKDGVDKTKLTVAKCYKNLISDLWSKDRVKYLNPTNLLRAIRIHNSIFRGFSQQDTQEFLRCLMDRLHEELKCPVIDLDKNNEEDESMDEEDCTVTQKKLLGGNASHESSESQDLHESKTFNSKKRTISWSQKQKIKKSKVHQTEYTSIITSVFDGKLLSSVQCLTCNRLSSRLETFQDLSLPIPNKEELSRIHTQYALPSSGIVTDTGWISYAWYWMKSWLTGPNIQLQDCLKAFFTNDELKGDNMYSCEKCKKLRNGIKYSRVNSLPEVLCIHLKRFRHELFYSSKISTYISFPLKDLDMEMFLSKDCQKSSSCSKYDLTAVITHFGSVGGGHYIAHAKNYINGKWYEFNDSHVTEVSETSVLNTEAYVLFYTLKDNTAEMFRKEINAQLNSNKNYKEKYYISSEWFTKFNACIKPGPVSNYNILCKHLAVKISLSQNVDDLVVTVPKSVSQNLILRFGGGPEIRSLAACTICQELADRGKLELDTFTKMHDKFKHEENYLVRFKLSIDWYEKWHAFALGKQLELPGPIKNEHLVEENSEKGNSFGFISEEIWTFFFTKYGGGPAVWVQDGKLFIQQ